MKKIILLVGLMILFSSCVKENVSKQACVLYKNDIEFQNVTVYYEDPYCIIEVKENFTTTNSIHCESLRQRLNVIFKHSNSSSEFKLLVENKMPKRMKSQCKIQ